MQSSSLSSSSSSLSYNTPPWCCDLVLTWRLIEIKSGVQVAVHDLNAACTVLGRAVEDLPQSVGGETASMMINRIPLLHESCSRLHARIAFDKQGIMWLRDLASAHGTTVNKKRLPAAACGKLESNDTTAGARGVILKAGDVIQFGASTRLYCVEGPENDSNSVNSSVFGAVNGTKRAPQEQEKPQQEDTPEIVLDLNDPNVVMPDKYRTEWEQVKALHYKYTNIQIESDRIRRKGGALLTDGQEAQLQRNQEREVQLAQEIESRKEALLEKLNTGEQTGRQKQLRHPQKSDEEDLDDFYDKTRDAPNDHLLSSDEAMSEEDLISAWNRQNDLYVKASDSLGQFQRRVDLLRSRLKDLEQQDGDDFFTKNELDLASDDVKRKQQHINTIADQLQETKRLLHVVNPDVASRLHIGRGFEKRTASTNESIKGEDGFSMPAPPPLPVKSQATEKQPLPPPPIQNQATELSPPVKNQATDPSEPPPKRQRSQPKQQMGPTLPAELMQSRQGTLSTNKGAARTTSNYTSSTIAAMRAISSSSSSPIQQQQSQDTASTSLLSSISTTTSKKVLDDEKQDSWQAPKDQDGSGWTKLNQKFAGRY